MSTEAIVKTKKTICDWIVGLVGQDEQRAAEIGVHRFQLANLLLDCIAPLSIYLVDSWRETAPDATYRAIGDPIGTSTQKDQDGWYIEAVTKALPYCARAHILNMESTVAASMLHGTGVVLDWVFIDADHSYEGRLEDLKNWTPLVRNDGWVMGGLRKSAYGGDCGGRALKDYLQDSRDVLVGPYQTWAFRR